MEVLDPVIVFVWSEWNGHQQDKGLSEKRRTTFCTRIKIMWEEQPINTPIDYKHFNLKILFCLAGIGIQESEYDSANFLNQKSS